ncbi:Glu/Leu/Phe/Val family dehydrogenase [Palleronia rufa]|uniref:Glu/Leu/Phe/Val family dehydrogenase n=1 Tax=Palleronia rufa TaxID=1530186 RepID=UPI00056C90B6|nr:Glu/Leu/Phe/Val dehydrogenase dimerization domain-containing protein [Palleronia rufa]
MRIEDMATDTHERVLRVTDEGSGLTGYIAIHSTTLGPAAGGLRMRVYGDEAAALEDVLRLSRGMTYKNAAADLPLGGGKAVILGDPDAKTPAQLRAMGRAVESLAGLYWTAEDMGMAPGDMAELARETGYVAGLASGRHASGDPSPVTARGVFESLRVTARHRFGSDDLSGLRIAVQGLGHVGRALAELLAGAGARLIVADPRASEVDRAVADLSARSAAPDGILAVDADILAPCAVGAVLNADTVPALRVAAVCGAANNQLAGPEDADRLHRRGILYAPDYIANAGGIVNVATEILRIDDAPAFVAEKLDALGRTLDRILTRAAAARTSPHHLADAIVAERIRAG